MRRTAIAAVLACQLAIGTARADVPEGPPLAPAPGVSESERSLLAPEAVGDAAALDEPSPEVAFGADPDRRRDLSVFIGDHPGWDGLFVAAGFGVWLVGRYALDPREADVAPLDGGGYRRYRHRADVASDVVVGASLAAALGSAYLTERLAGRTWSASFRAPIVLSEALLLGFLFTTWTKNVGVCRPFAWDEVARQCMDGSGPPVGVAERHRAFPSGHTTSIASVAGASFGLWLLPRRTRPELAPLALGTTALAWLAGGLRVRAGAHSWVDVAGGFAVPVALGFAASAAHLRTTRVGVAPSANGLVAHGRF